MQGQTSATPAILTVTAKNGTATLSPQITSGPYSIASMTCTGTLAAGTSCTISVSFTPTALGVAPGVLTVAPGVTVALTGTGIAPAGFELSGADLGTVQLNVPVAGSVTVTATTAVAGLSCSTSGADITADPSKACPATLANGASCTFGFTFKATTTGAKTDKVVCTATGSTRTGTVTANVVSPAALDFASKTAAVTSPVGTPSSPVAFTLVNLGGSPSGALTLTPSGDTTQFTIDNQCLVPLAANLSCKISVVFNPSAAGQKNLTLTVTDAASPTTSLVATLAGTGLPPGSLTITGDGAFAPTVVGSATVAKVFTIANPGQAATGVVTIGVSDPQFVISADGCSNQPIAAGKSCTVSLVFKPSAAAAATANLTASATGTATASLPLTGTGIGGPALTLTPSTLDFSGVVVNTSSAPKTFTIKNVGQSETGALEIVKNDSTSSVGGGSQFTVTGTCAASLKPNDECTVSVVFSPLQAGAASSSIVVRTADRAVSTQEGTLLGLGLDKAKLAITVCTAAFGDGTVVGQTATDTCTVTNSADTASGAISVKVDGDYSIPAATNNCATANLQTGTTCTFVVAFTPTAKGDRSGTITVTSANAGTANMELKSTALGIVEIVEYDQATHTASTLAYDFGQTTVAIPATKKLVLAVYVRASVGNLSVTSSLGSPAQFALGTQANVTALVGNSANFGGAQAGALAGLQCSAAYAASDPTAATGIDLAKPVCYEVVTFTPTVRATASGSVTVSGAANRSDTAPFTGIGAGPLTISPSPVTFSNVAVGTASSALTVTITNNGATTIKGMSVVLDGANKAEFSIVTDGVTGADLTTAARSKSIAVKFIPTSTGAKTATVTMSGTLMDTDGTTAIGTETATVNLLANGATGASVTTAITNNGVFADTAAGAYSAPLTVTVNNSGSLATGALTFTDDGDFTFTPPVTTPATTQGTCFPAGSSLAGGASCTALVWFKPAATSAIVARTGIIKMTDGATNTIYRMSVSGNALPQLVIAPAGTVAAPVDLGTAIVSTTTAPSVTFTVTNNSASPIAAGDLTITKSASANGPNLASLFTIGAGANNTCSGVVQKNGGTCTFKVTANATDASQLGTYYTKLTVALAATTQTATAELKATVVDAPQLAFSASTNLNQDIGMVQFGSASAPVKYTVVNAGGTNTGAITANLYKTGGAGSTDPQTKPSHLTVDASACTSLAEVGLAPGKTCDILVTAHPNVNNPSDSGQTFTADLSVKAANVTGVELRKTITATSTSATAPSGAFIIEQSSGAAPADLGVRDGTAAFTVSKTLVLQAPDGAFTPTDLAVDSVAGYTAPDGTDETIAITGGTCQVGTAVTAGSSCTIVVTWKFTPGVLVVAPSGARAFTVTADNANPVTINLAGTVGARAALSVSRSSVDFGDVLMAGAGQSAQETLVVTNVGEIQTAGNVTVTPSSAPIHFSGCGVRLRQFESCTLTVWVKPQAAGDSAGENIVVKANGVVDAAGAAVSETVNVSWTGVVTSELSTTAGQTDFGEQAVLSTAGATKPFTFKNIQNGQTTGPLAVSVVDSSGVAVPDFVIVTAGSSCLTAGTLDGNATCDVVLRFVPAALASPAKSAKLTVTATPGGTVTVDLSGTAIPALSVSSAGMVTDADGVNSVSVTTAVGATSAEITATFTNAAGAPATGLLATELAGADAGEFRITADECVGITRNATQTCNVKFVFAPATAGAKTATLKVSGNPGDSATLVLKGNP